MTTKSHRNLSHIYQNRMENNSYLPQNEFVDLLLTNYVYIVSRFLTLALRSTSNFAFGTEY